MSKLSQSIKTENNSDPRLSYTLITLGLEELVHLFQENNITFIDMLLLSKDDLKEFQLEMFQRNRIWNFINSFNKYGKNYSLSEVTDFFNFNKQFIFNLQVFEKIDTLPNNINYQITGSFGNINKNQLNTNSSKEEEHINFKGKSNMKLIHDEPEDQVQQYASSQEALNKNEKVEKKMLRPNKITLTTSKEELLDNQDMGEENEGEYTTNIKEEGRNKSKKQLNKNGDSFKQKRNSQNVYSKYLSIQKESENILERLSKLKEESNTKHNKYKNLVSKSKKIYMRNYAYSNYNQYDNDQEFIQDQENNLNQDQEEENEIDEQNKQLEIEYDQMINRIEETEKLKMDYGSFQYLNKIKQFVSDKDDKITLHDIQVVNEGLDKLNGLITKKEMLQKSLNDCNNKINEKKQQLNHLENEDGGFDDMNNNDVQEVEELEEEYEQESYDKGKILDRSA